METNAVFLGDLSWRCWHRSDSPGGASSWDVCQAGTADPPQLHPHPPICCLRTSPEQEGRAGPERGHWRVALLCASWEGLGSARWSRTPLEGGDPGASAWELGWGLT